MLQKKPKCVQRAEMTMLENSRNMLPELVSIWNYFKLSRCKQFFQNHNVKGESLLMFIPASDLRLGSNNAKNDYDST